MIDGRWLETNHHASSEQPEAAATSWRNDDFQLRKAGGWGSGKAATLMDSASLTRTEGSGAVGSRSALLRRPPRPPSSSPSGSPRGRLGTLGSSSEFPSSHSRFSKSSMSSSSSASPSSGSSSGSSPPPGEGGGAMRVLVNVRVFPANELQGPVSLVLSASPDVHPPRQRRGYRHPVGERVLHQPPRGQAG